MKRKLLAITMAAMIAASPTIAFAAEYTRYDLNTAVVDNKDMTMNLSIEPISVSEGSRALHSYIVNYKAAGTTNEKDQRFAKLHIFLRSDWATTPLALINPPLMETIYQGKNFVYVIEPNRSNEYTDQGTNFKNFDYLLNGTSYGDFLESFHLGELDLSNRRFANDFYHFEVPAGLEDTVGLTKIIPDSDINALDAMQFIYTPVGKRITEQYDVKAPAQVVATYYVFDNNSYENLVKKESGKVGVKIVNNDTYTVIAAISNDNPYNTDTKDYSDYEYALKAVRDIETKLELNAGTEKKSEAANTTRPEKDSILVNKKNLAGKTIKSSDGTIMIPLREVAETLGYEVNWTHENGVRRAEVLKANRFSEIIIGQNQYGYADATFELEAKPMLIYSKTYVPYSFAEKVLAGKVTAFDNDSVVIDKIEQ